MVRLRVKEALMLPLCLMIACQSSGVDESATTGGASGSSVAGAQPGLAVAGGLGVGGMSTAGVTDSDNGEAGVLTAGGGQSGKGTGGVTSASGGGAGGGTLGGGAGGGTHAGGAAGEAGSGAAGNFGGSAGDCLNAASNTTVIVDSTVEKRSGFESGTTAPYQICTTKNPNYGLAASVGGRSAIKFFWTQVGYDGTRDKRGAEACSDLEFAKDGWYGFQFYLPTPGFPTDKTEGIAQIFSKGGCSSWAGMLEMRDNELWFQHRPACVDPTEVRLATAVPRNTWNSVIIHFTASHQMAGGIQIWFGDAASACTAVAPTYSKTGINFGFGTWDGDQLAAGASNTIGLKFGMYDFDDGNYTVGETRTLYYDNVTQLAGNPSNAWMLVNPARSDP